MLAYYRIIQPSVVEVNKRRQMKASHFRRRAITMYSRVATDCFQRNGAKNAKKDFNFFSSHYLLGKVLFLVKILCLLFLVPDAPPYASAKSY
jgi:hypothetical protein